MWKFAFECVEGAWVEEDSPGGINFVRDNDVTHFVVEYVFDEEEGNACGVEDGVDSYEALLGNPKAELEGSELGGRLWRAASPCE